ncbi:hypothetical protein XENOCAPTIV_013397, partial [Xenoophorus captivus]
RLQTKCCKEHVRECLRTMEEVLMKTEVNRTTSICANSSVAVLHKPPSSGCNGLEMYVSEPEMQGAADKDLSSRKVRVKLPSEVNLGPNNT